MNQKVIIGLISCGVMVIVIAVMLECPPLPLSFALFGSFGLGYFARNKDI